MKLFGDRPQNIVRKLPVADIAPNPAQPRRAFDEQALAALADSIRENGLLQPITVRRRPGGYELIAGERRLLAHARLGLASIDAIVLEASDRDSAVLALTENLQRSDLSLFDEAEGIAALLAVWGLPREEAARRLCCAPSTLSNKLRLLRLAPDMRSAITEHSLTERHARALLKLPSDEARRAALAKMIAAGMNVTAAEQYVESLLAAPPRSPAPRRVLVVRDVRLFQNTIEHAVLTMKSAGIEAASTLSETEAYLEYVIRIPRASAYKRAN